MYKTYMLHRIVSCITSQILSYYLTHCSAVVKQKSKKSSHCNAACLYMKQGTHSSSHSMCNVQSWKQCALRTVFTGKFTTWMFKIHTRLARHILRGSQVITTWLTSLTKQHWNDYGSHHTARKADLTAELCSKWADHLTINRVFYSCHVQTWNQSCVRATSRTISRKMVAFRKNPPTTVHHARESNVWDFRRHDDSPSLLCFQAREKYEPEYFSDYTRTNSSQ